MPCPCTANIEVTSIAVTAGTAFVMTVPANTFRNGRYYNFLIPQTLPLAGQTGTEPVTITDGTTTYTALDPIGNTLVSGYLRGRDCSYKPKRLRAVYGANPEHFQFKEISPCLQYVPATA